MLIFEGTDASGKTTLMQTVVGKMAKHLFSEGVSNLNVQHFGMLPPDWDYFKDYIDRIGINSISDRFIHSELVYGPVLRGYINEKLNETRISMIMMELLGSGSMVVHVRPPDEVIESRYRSRKEGDKEIDGGGEDIESRIKKGIKTIKELNNAFDCLDWQIPKIKVENNLTFEDNDIISDEIINQWNIYRKRALEYEKIDGNGWGSLNPEVMFIGERPNRSKNIMKSNPVLRPFAGPGPYNSSSISTSSEWLFRMIKKSNLLLKDVHVANAYTFDNSEKTKIIEQIEFLKPKKIVLMGGFAKRLLVDDYNIDLSHLVFSMPHPQYLRRFRQNNLKDYCVRLENFLNIKHQNVGLFLCDRI